MTDSDELTEVSPRASLVSDEAIDSTGALTPSRSTAETENVVTRTLTNRTAPLPGHTYKIVSASCGRQIMVLRGHVVLASPEELGSPHWTCEASGGWLGFRNAATGKALGHDSGNPGMIRCEAQNLLQWEQMLAIPHTRTEGAYSILIEYWYGQRAIGLYEDEEETRLCRIKDMLDPGNAWIFVEL